MKKMGKIITFLIILLLLTGGIILKSKSNLDENIYVVSQSEIKDKKTTLDIDDTETKKEDSTSEVNLKSDENMHKRMITIYISGEINNPGIVTIENDKRLADAIEQLGGLTKDADLNRINMAAKINDEEHYIIPKIGEEIPVQNGISGGNELDISNTSNKDLDNNDKKVNINKATIQELDTLPGVGEATANKIVKYREENSVFKSIEEIKNVNGIGDKKYEDLKDLISVN